MAKDAKGHGSNTRGGYTKATDPAKRARQIQYIQAHYAAQRAHGNRSPEDIAAEHGIDTSHLQVQKPFDEAAADEAAKWM